MSENYRNIFDYYRGRAPKGSTNNEKVLENNVTKALLNTIDLCPNLDRRFINWLNERHLGEKQLSLNPPGGTDFERPTRDEKRNANVTKILLGIKKHKGDYPRDTRKGNRLDATIIGQGWLVAIESKLTGMNKQQFRNEEKLIKATKAIQVLWKEVKECFEEAAKDPTCLMR
jgi:hypothetical protein